jgi:hypothetical protein
MGDDGKQQQTTMTTDENNRREQLRSESGVVVFTSRSHCSGIKVGRSAEVGGGGNLLCQAPDRSQLPLLTPLLRPG